MRNNDAINSLDQLRPTEITYWVKTYATIIMSGADLDDLLLRAAH